MVELTRARGIDARVGDVQALPFEDGDVRLRASRPGCSTTCPTSTRRSRSSPACCAPGGRLVAVDERASTTSPSCGALVGRAARAGRSAPRTARRLARTSPGRAARRERRGRVPDARRRRRRTSSAIARTHLAGAAAGVRRAARRARRARHLRRGGRRDPRRRADRAQARRRGAAAEEMRELVLGYARGDVPDYQMAAFCMAVFFRGLTAAETHALTDAMVRSGETLDLSARSAARPSTSTRPAAWGTRRRSRSRRSSPPAACRSRR